MRYTVNLDCKTHHVDRNGEIPVLLRVSINGEHGYLNTGKKININYYDKEQKAIKPSVKGSTVLNVFVSKQKDKVFSIIDEYEKRNEVATFKKIKEEYFRETGKVKSECFYQFVEDRINWEIHTSTVTKGTLKNYLANLKKVV